MSGRHGAQRYGGGHQSAVGVIMCGLSTRWKGTRNLLRHGVRSGVHFPPFILGARKQAGTEQCLDAPWRN